MELFIGDKQDHKDEFPKSYLEINVSPKDQMFVNRVVNPFANRTDHPSEFKHIVLGESETGIEHSTSTGNQSYISTVTIPWKNIYAS